MVAQYLVVCSSAKTCEIGENLLSVADPISRPEERLIHAGALVCPPPLQRRSVSRLTDAWQRMMQEAFDDLKAGRMLGPFETVEEFKQALKTRAHR